MVYALSDPSTVSRESVGDLDFLIGKEDHQAFDRLLRIITEHYGGQCTYSVPTTQLSCAERLSDVTISVANIQPLGAPIQFQLILTDAWFISEVLESFDLDYVQCGLYGGRVWTTPACDRALRDHRVHEYHTAALRWHRLVKAARKGFPVKVCFDEFRVGRLSLTEISLERLLQVKKAAVNIPGAPYATTDAEFEQRMLEIEPKIRQAALGALVTTPPQHCLQTKITTTQHAPVFEPESAKDQHGGDQIFRLRKEAQQLSEQGKDREVYELYTNVIWSREKSVTGGLRRAVLDQYEIIDLRQQPPKENHKGVHVSKPVQFCLGVPKSKDNPPLTKRYVAIRVQIACKEPQVLARIIGDFVVHIGCVPGVYDQIEPEQVYTLLIGAHAFPSSLGAKYALKAYAILTDPGLEPFAFASTFPMEYLMGSDGLMRAHHSLPPGEILAQPFLKKRRKVLCERFLHSRSQAYKYAWHLMKTEQYTKQKALAGAAQQFVADVIKYQPVDVHPLTFVDLRMALPQLTTEQALDDFMFRYEDDFEEQ